jgi:PAS domain S-box-containing protein
MVSARFGALLLLEDDKLPPAPTRATFRCLPRRRSGAMPVCWRGGRSTAGRSWCSTTTPAGRSVARGSIRSRCGAVAVLPVLLRGSSIGVLELARDEPGRPFTLAETRRGALFAQMAALVIDHARVYEDALRQLAERARAEVALREQEARLAGIIDSAIDAIITVDEERRIVVFNDAAARIFGCTTEAALGSPLATLIPDHQAIIDAARNAAARGIGEPTPLRGIRGSGEGFPIEVSVARVAVGGRES